MILRPFLPESPLWHSETRRGHAARARAFASCSTPRLRRVTIAHHRAGGLLLRAGLRHAAAHSARRARLAAGGRTGAQAAGAMGELGAPARRFRRASSAACCSRPRDVPRGAPPDAALRCSWPGWRCFHSCSSGRHWMTHRHLQVRGAARDAGGGRAVQLLGQLPAAGVPAAPARHGREFRDELRRPRAGAVRGARHHAALEPCCPARRRRSSSRTSMALVAVVTHRAARCSARAAACPSRRAELPED